MYVIGTAGHVDHGKSALVRALTGIDPDRLPEEKAREMTIDLGFAWLRLPSGLKASPGGPAHEPSCLGDAESQEVSIVDVPGHQRFLDNMLAGVGGINLALLVVAADEGVMPQTREHLAILDLLEVKHGVLVITKTDLVEEEWLELVAADVRAAVAGTSLAEAPLVACSARTGQGLAELLAALEGELARVPPPRDVGRPRLSIDRAFTVAGFGTVVTGTLIDGALALGQEVELLPGGRRARIRGLQTHRHKLERALPGSRTAVNLAGLPHEELARGMVVTTPGWLAPTTALDVRLRAVSYLPRPIRHNLHVSFHTGAAEIAGVVRLLEQEALAPGQEGWAQLRLAAPLAVARGDGFILRTPNDTVGGGRVVDIHAPRHRRRYEPTLRALEALMPTSSAQEALPALVARLEPCELGALAAQSSLGPGEVTAAAQELVEAGRLVALGSSGGLRPDTILYSREGFAALARRAQGALEAFHRHHLLRSGMGKEELRSALGLGSRVFDGALARWLDEGLLEERRPLLGPHEIFDFVGYPLLALHDHQPRPSPLQESQAQGFLQALRQSPYQPPTDRSPDPELLAYLEERGEVVRVSEGVVFAAEAYQAMVGRIVEHLGAQGTITLAQVRDMFGTSRKYAQAILEHLDQRRVTRRVGDERVLRQAEGTGP